MDRYTLAVAAWQHKKIRTDADLDEALSSQGVLFSYHSGKLENDRITYHDTREIFDHDGVTSYTGDLRTLFEIRNAKDAYEFFLSAYGEGRDLDETFLKSLQECLTKNTYDTRQYQLGERPGQYKQHDHVTGRNEIGASAEDVEEEITELLAEMHDIPERHVLTAAAYFHVKFENIHPFADGNGRTGRLAMNYFLVTHKHPPITVYEEDRKEYFSALDAWDTKQELTTMIRFLQKETEKTWKKEIEKELERRMLDQER